MNGYQFLCLSRSQAGKYISVCNLALIRFISGAVYHICGLCADSFISVFVNRRGYQTRLFSLNVEEEVMKASYVIIK
jgi:hypothetical protein